MLKSQQKSLHSRCTRAHTPHVSAHVRRSKPQSTDSVNYLLPQIFTRFLIDSRAWAPYLSLPVNASTFREDRGARAACKLNSRQPPYCQHNSNHQLTTIAVPIQPTHRITHEGHSDETRVRVCRGGRVRTTVLLTQPATPSLFSTRFRTSTTNDERISKMDSLQDDGDHGVAMFFLHMLAGWTDTTSACTCRRRA